jgi:hypothetical protein
MSNKFEGKIIAITETVQVSDKFKKREIVLEDNGTYPQTICFQLAQDKCDLVNPLIIGQMATVHYNLRGKSWTNPQGETKYFNTLDVWKIEANVTGNHPTDAPKPVQASNSNDEDLPY